MKYVALLLALVLGFVLSRMGSCGTFQGSRSSECVFPGFGPRDGLPTCFADRHDPLWLRHMGAFYKQKPQHRRGLGFQSRYFRRNRQGTDGLKIRMDQMEEVGFGNYIEGLNTGRYDAMCQTVWPDPGRFKNATITFPVHYHKVYVVVRADDTRFDQGYDKLNDPTYTTAAIDADITQSIAESRFSESEDRRAAAKCRCVADFHGSR